MDWHVLSKSGRQKGFNMERRYYLNGDDWEIKDFLGEDWVWRNAEKRNTRDVRWWRRACVPGSITNDLWKTGEIPDPYFEKNRFGNRSR